jgi:hypothetical protein
MCRHGNPRSKAGAVGRWAEWGSSKTSTAAGYPPGSVLVLGGFETRTCAPLDYLAVGITVVSTIAC